MKTDTEQSLLAQFKAEEGSRWGFRTYRGKRQIYFKDVNGTTINENIFPTGRTLSLDNVRKSWLNKFLDLNTWKGCMTGQPPMFEIGHLLGIFYREVADYALDEYHKERFQEISEKREREEREKQEKKEAEFSRQVIQVGNENFST